jgi:hypothetical protein
MSYLDFKKTKIYGNYKVYSPDGKLMFRCGVKKAKWYLNKNLAHSVGENIYLNFNPNGLGYHNKEYGLNEMENKCVVCGSLDNLTRHHVVPFMYRKHFPLSLKSHNFHDILVMCVPCHENYEKKADIYKKYLFKHYNVENCYKPTEEEILINKKRKISMVLLYNSENIPKNRILELKSELRKISGIKRITKKRLLNFSKIAKKSNENSIKLLISKVDIESFIISWRKHFIENNKCNHLPKNWSIFYKKD